MSALIVPSRSAEPIRTPNSYRRSCGRSGPPILLYTRAECATRLSLSFGRIMCTAVAGEHDRIGRMRRHFHGDLAAVVVLTPLGHELSPVVSATLGVLVGSGSTATDGEVK